MIYLIYGNYTYFLEQKLQELKSNWISRNNSGKFETISGSEVNELGDLKLSNSLDLFATPSLIIVKEIDELSATVSKKFLSWLGTDLPESQDIILYENSNLSEKNVLLVGLKALKTVEFKFVKPQFENQENFTSIKFVSEILTQRKYKFDSSIPREIVNFVGTDLFTLKNELSKLDSIEINEISYETIKKYFVENHSSIIFNLVNLIFDQNWKYSQFLEELNFQLQDPTIFILLTSLLTRELRIKYLKSSDMFLKKLYNELLEIDIQFKSGGNPRELIVKFYLLVHEEYLESDEFKIFKIEEKKQ